MTRTTLWEILENIHFADNLQNAVGTGRKLNVLYTFNLRPVSNVKLPPRDSEQYNSSWKLQHLFDHFLKHF